MAASPSEPLKLVQALYELPEEWSLTPVLGNKAPYRPKWQDEPLLSRDAIAAEIKSGQAKGYGIRTGGISGGIVAVDLDGSSAHPKILEWAGSEELPKTVAFTSGRPGRSQHLFRIPEQYWSAIQTKKYKTGVHGDDGKPEQVELRWNGCQSVLPPSAHPITEQYRWLKDCSPWQCKIADAPIWLIEKMLSQPQQSQQASVKPPRPSYLLERWTDKERAISYLEALAPGRADDHDDWLKVGMALESVDDSFQNLWDQWSQQSSKYKPGECARRWKSFKNSGGITLGTLASMAKQDGWRSPFNSSDSPRSSLQVNQNIDEPKVKTVSLRDRVSDILNRNSTKSERKEAFIELAKATNIHLRSVEDLAKAIEGEVEQLESRANTASELDKLLEATKAFLDIRSILPESLAEPLVKLARWLNIKPEVYLTTLITGVSSLHKVGTRVVINNDWDFEVTPNIYGGIVAESGQGKSPILKTIISKPLGVLQAKAREEFKEAKRQYQADKARYNDLREEERAEAFPDGPPQEPRQKLYSFSSCTGEGLLQQVQAYPQQGLLYMQDELAGILKSSNQYRQGRGSDEEDLLSYYDGTGGTVLRASGVKADLDGLLLAMLGSIQSGVLQSFLKDCSDSNGKWARFIFVSQPLAPSEMSSDGGSFNITTLLADLYQQVDALPVTTYRLDYEAFQYFCKAHNQLEQRRVNDPSQGMRAVWSKSKGRIGKLAVNLHVIHELLAGRHPSEIIPKARVVEAVKLTSFYAKQVQAIHANFADPDAIAPHLAAVIKKSELKGWLKASDVYPSITPKHRPDATTVRDWFNELVQMGKGEIRGTGKSLEFHCLDTSIKSDLSQTSQKSQTAQDACAVNVSAWDNSSHESSQNSDLSQTDPIPLRDRRVNAVLDEPTFVSSVWDESLSLRQVWDKSSQAGSTKVESFPQVWDVWDVLDDSPEKVEEKVELSNQDPALLPPVELAPTDEQIKAGDRVVIDSPGVKRHDAIATVVRIKASIKGEERVMLADLRIPGENRLYEAQQSWLKRMKASD